MARTTSRRKIHRTLVPDCQGGRYGCSRHVRELPLDRIPAPSIPRLFLLQRLPRIPGFLRGLPLAVAQSERRPSRPPHGDRAGQPARGEERQAMMLESQIASAFHRGCVGVIVFAWTDEWYHGKYRVEDWAFGLTTRERTPKPALPAVAKAFAEGPFPSDLRWPKISVVVCTYNGASTIRDTLEALRDLDYPSFEVIVVNDGSTDETPQIASNYPYRIINEENQGLSRARNTGIAAATGEIVAFIDDDAYP